MEYSNIDQSNLNQEDHNDSKVLDFKDDEEEGKEGQTWTIWFSKKIQSYDIFGVPVGLKFNKKPKYSTVPGGICSILMVSIFTLICVIQGVQFFFYSTPTDVASF